MNFNQINCYSCGAPLKKPKGLCRCEYCRNLNLTQGGKSQIVQVLVPGTTKTYNELSPAVKKLLPFLIVLFPLAFLAHYRKPIALPKTKVRLANGAIIEI